MADFVEVPVLAAWDETPSLRAVAVDLGALAAQHTAPGQVLQAQAGDGVGYFALANAPSPSRRAELLVKRGGAVADALVARAAPGATLAVTAPQGRGFPIAAARSHDLLLFAVGSGIAPIRAVVQHVIAARSEFGHIALFFGARDEFAFAGEFGAWEAGGVHVVACRSGADDHWVGARGYVQEVARSHEWAIVHPERTVAFLCGLKGMVSAVREMLAARGLPVERTYLNF